MNIKKQLINTDLGLYKMVEDLQERLKRLPIDK